MRTLEELEALVEREAKAEGPTALADLKAQRRRLRSLLRAQLNPGRGAELLPGEWERAWTDEVTRRARAIDGGESELIDGDEALRRVRAKLVRSG